MAKKRSNKSLRGLPSEHAKSAAETLAQAKRFATAVIDSASAGDCSVALGRFAAVHEMIGQADSDIQNSEGRGDRAQLKAARRLAADAQSYIQTFCVRKGR